MTTLYSLSALNKFPSLNINAAVYKTPKWPKKVSFDIWLWNIRDVSIGLRNSLIEFVQLKKKKKGFIMIGLFSLEKIMIFGPGLNGLGILWNKKKMFVKDYETIIVSYTVFYFADSHISISRLNWYWVK